jgi:diadenosine tetraphosphatase ApaH/serine/threonine PP2A family protein phosphatase
MKDIRYIINVGSVGQPRDLDSRAAFGFIDTSTFAYQLMRVEYDIKATVDAVRKIGLPRFQGRRLFDGV